VEVQGARKDASLKAFEGLGASELSSSTDFYSAMVSNAAYDRTIFIKLAMALQTDLMIRGLVEELQISAKNSVSNFCYLHKYIAALFGHSALFMFCSLLFYWLIFKHYVARCY
jgi:hypothetical protein